MVRSPRFHAHAGLTQRSTVVWRWGNALCIRRFDTVARRGGQRDGVLDVREETQVLLRSGSSGSTRAF